MNPSHLWKTFVEAPLTIPQLRQLGMDIHAVRARPSGNADAILGRQLGLSADLTWKALNTNPGALTLHQMKSDYQAKAPWSRTGDLTKAYITRVAHRIAIIRKGLSERVAKQTSSPIWPFFLGTGMILGALSYISHKGQRELHRHLAHQKGIP